MACSGVQPIFLAVVSLIMKDKVGLPAASTGRLTGRSAGVRSLPAISCIFIVFTKPRSEGMQFTGNRTGPLPLSVLSMSIQPTEVGALLEPVICSTPGIVLIAVFNA